jgi:hypothetical protein
MTRLIEAEPDHVVACHLYTGTIPNPQTEGAVA